MPRQGKFTTAVAYATAHMAALFIKYFPRELAGVFAPEMLPPETRRAILAGIRNNSIRILHKTTLLKHTGEDADEFYAGSDALPSAGKAPLLCQIRIKDQSAA